MIQRPQLFYGHPAAYYADELGITRTTARKRLRAAEARGLGFDDAMEFIRTFGMDRKRGDADVIFCFGLTEYEIKHYKMIQNYLMRFGNNIRR
jgi:hypothetical protein